MGQPAEAAESTAATTGDDKATMRCAASAAVRTASAPTPLTQPPCPRVVFCSLRDEAAPGAQRTCCFGGVLTPNSKVLLVTMGFFTTITIAQVFAAIQANSSALMADCVSMGLDAASALPASAIPPFRRSPADSRRFSLRRQRDLGGVAQPRQADAGAQPADHVVH